VIVVSRLSLTRDLVFLETGSTGLYFKFTLSILLLTIMNGLTRSPLLARRIVSRYMYTIFLESKRTPIKMYSHSIAIRSISSNAPPDPKVTINPEPGYNTGDVTNNQNRETEYNNVLRYKGTFAVRVRRLRRISLTSTILSFFFLSYAATMHSDVVSMTGQIAISSTVLLTSFSSTCMLHLVIHPYVESLHEVVPVNKNGDNPSISSSSDRKFVATRYNMLGNLKRSEFKLSQTDKNVLNPFASFQVKPGGYFYVQGENLDDPDVKQTLTRD
jgi:hypothetical protein